MSQLSWDKHITEVVRRGGAGRGGVATFVKQGLDSEEIKFQHSKKEIQVAITRFFGTKDTDIVNFNIPPRTNVMPKDYMEIYQKLGKKINVFRGFQHQA